MSITAKELAKRLGLSEAAVSMALNQKSGVSTATRQMVLAAAQQYGYDFTRVRAKRGRQGSVYLIYYRKHGAIVNDNPFFSELSESIQHACGARNYRLNIRYLYEGPELARQLADIVCSDCAGILLMGTEMREGDFASFAPLNLPLVILDSYLGSSGRDCVLINNMQGAFLATDYLIRQVKRQPGYLRSAYPIHNFNERADGFYQAIRSHGLSTSKSPVHWLTPSVEGACADLLALLDAGETPAPCYFADNDLIALGAMQAFQKRGLSVPGDVSVVGFDNIPLCNYCSPPLTTVNVPKTYIGEMAVERLFHLLEADHFAPIKLQVQTDLVLRRSVKSVGRDFP